MGLVYFDCGNCGETFHIDDDDLKCCDSCGYVCSQCCTTDDDNNVIECESCEKIKLEETKDKIQEAKKESLILDIETLQDLCLKKHKDDVKYIIEKIKIYINDNTK